MTRDVNANSQWDNGQWDSHQCDNVYVYIYMRVGMAMCMAIVLVGVLHKGQTIYSIIIQINIYSHYSYDI